MTNEELAKNYQAGNIEVFETLWNKNLGLAKTIVKKYRYINGYDFEDLLSECEAEFWRWLPKFDQSKGSFAWYMGRVMESKMKQLLEKSKTKSRDGVVVYLQQPIGEEGDITLEDVLESSDMENWINDYGDNEFLAEALSIFARSADRMELGILEARVISGYSISEISRHIGWRREKIRNTLNDSLNRIREICASLLECSVETFSKRRGELCHVYEVS